VLFDGLVRQSDMNCMLDEFFGDLEGASQNEAEEGMVLTLREEGEW